MPEAPISNRRGGPVAPTSYDDVAAVVHAVRKARQSIVEFSWRLDAEQIRELRTAIASWSSSVVGRYKTFDARVLSALNTALGESDTRFVLNEPRNGAIDCAVECTGSDDSYVVQGHAPFDVVMGYGLAGADGGAAVVHLSDETRAALAAAVDALGWSAVRMREKRLVPARNALYGFPLAYGTEDVPRSTEPPVDVQVKFRGPFSAVDGGSAPLLFADPVARANGVYFWTVAVDGVDHVCYVGQTRRGFGARIEEHLSAILSGKYDILDPDAMSRGETRAVWRAEPDPASRWRRFLGQYRDLSTHIARTIDLLRFYVAPIEGDPHLISRVEGALGGYYRERAPTSARRLFDLRIRVPSPIPGDRPLRLVPTSTAPLAGLPSELLI
jgi:hypothetical protein